MKNFYRWLLSSSWADRLRAYTCIERDLRNRRRWSMSEDKWEDMKMLVGQIISIHFKKYPARDEQEFSRRLTRLYLVVLNRLADEGGRKSTASFCLLAGI